MRVPTGHRFAWEAWFRAHVTRRRQLGKKASMPHGGVHALVKACEASRNGMQQRCASSVDSMGWRRA